MQEYWRSRRSRLKQRRGDGEGSDDPPTKECGGETGNFCCGGLRR
jgi:hypothetical protein